MSDNVKKSPAKKPGAVKPKKIMVVRNGCNYLIDEKNLSNFIEAGWKRAK